MTQPTTTSKNFDQDSLLLHASGRPGKVEIVATKPLTTQRDLSLAYSPGVAAPCNEIHKDPNLAYDYTAKGNLVAVISNGTAVLGLGDLGALASKPVMEGKAVLFKRFADIDGIDLEVDTRDVEEFVNAVRYLGPSFGGINLEDIKAPECFIIEQRLRELMEIPVFHDDQHGTAIIALAGLINACDITGRKLADVRVVINGAGAAAIACAELIKAKGVKPENVIMCDTKGPIYQGREAGMNQWKSAHAAPTDARSLEDAMKGADVFMGLSVKGAVTTEMVVAMADRPIIFAMANPDPEITPEEVATVRSDAIMATGRSDYPNQINNVLGFPYIFRGALDVRAAEINNEMKIAAADALAELAREDVPDEVSRAYAGKRLRFGPEYVIPVPFDPRLIRAIPPAVARAAMDSGVARKPILDMTAYETELASRLDPSAASLQTVAATASRTPQRIIFAEGEEEKVIRAAIAFRNAEYGHPILVARRPMVLEKLGTLGLTEGDIDGIRIQSPRDENPRRDLYIQRLYDRLQRNGKLQADIEKMVIRDRTIYGACMVANGDADGLVSGSTRNYYQVLDDIRQVIDTRPGERLSAMVMLVVSGRTLFIADTAQNEVPEPFELADIAEQTAGRARQLGHEPRVAFLSYTNFGYPATTIAERVRHGVEILRERNVDFEFDGEMGVDVALDPNMHKLYPFCRLSGPANVLIMPALHAANISYRLLKHYSAGTSIGPILMGLKHPVQLVSVGCSVSDIVQMALMCAHESITAKQG